MIDFIIYHLLFLVSWANPFLILPQCLEGEQIVKLRTADTNFFHTGIDTPSPFSVSQKILTQFPNQCFFPINCISNGQINT